MIDFSGWLVLCSFYRHLDLLTLSLNFLHFSKMMFVPQELIHISIRKSCSSRISSTSPLEFCSSRISSTSPLGCLVLLGNSMFTNNYPTSLPLLIKLHLTFKIFLKFRNTIGLFLWACSNGSRPILSRLLFMGLGLGLSLTQYWIRPNFNLGTNNYYIQFNCINIKIVRLRFKINK